MEFPLSRSWGDNMAGNGVGHDLAFAEHSTQSWKDAICRHHGSSGEGSTLKPVGASGLLHRTRESLWAPAGLLPPSPVSFLAPNPVLSVLTLNRLDVDLNNIYPGPF